MSFSPLLISSEPLFVMARCWATEREFISSVIPWSKKKAEKLHLKQKLVNATPLSMEIIELSIY